MEYGIKRKNDIQISLLPSVKILNDFVDSYVVFNEDESKGNQRERYRSFQDESLHLWIDILTFCCINQFNNMFINIMLV